MKIHTGGKPGERDIVFTVSEGEVERIWSIDFVGNAAFSTDLLKARIKSRDARSGVTAYIFNKASQESLEEDKERLLNYYRGLGYFDARVDYSMDYDDSGKWIYVTFVVSEGAQYSVRNIELAGNQYFIPVKSCRSSNCTMPNLSIKGRKPTTNDSFATCTVKKVSSSPTLPADQISAR